MNKENKKATWKLIGSVINRKKTNCTKAINRLVYLNGNNAAEGENNIKYANSYPMN